MVTTPFPRAGNVEEVGGPKGKAKGQGLGAIFPILSAKILKKNRIIAKI